MSRREIGTHSANNSTIFFQQSNFQNLKMNCIVIIFFLAVGISVIPDGLALLIYRGTQPGNAAERNLFALQNARDTAIRAAHDRNATAHTAADKVKTDALAVTLAAVGVALAGVAKAPVGDATAAAALAGAVVDYNAVYVPAEAAHAIAYAAASAAAVIAINAANSAYTTAVTALG